MLMGSNQGRLVAGEPSWHNCHRGCHTQSFGQSVTFTQQLSWGSWSQTQDEDLPTQSPGAAGLPFEHGHGLLSRLRVATFQMPQICRPLCGAQREARRPGLGRPQMQAGEASAPCSAVAGPPSQEKLQPTYQHPRRRADDAPPLPSLPGSLPSPQAQPVLTFKAKCVSTIFNNIPSCGLLSAGYMDHSN